MINATQSTQTEKSTRTARRTVSKSKSPAPYRKPKSLYEALMQISVKLPPGYDFEKDREQYLRKKYGLK